MLRDFFLGFVKIHILEIRPKIAELVAEVLEGQGPTGLGEEAENNEDAR